MFGFSSFAEAPFASLATRILFAVASIDAYADVSCNANAINSVSASITATGSVSASSSAIYSGIGSINALATTSCYANANYSAFGAITCTANLAVSSLGNTWANVAVGNNTWTDTDSGLYVLDGYWVDGYVVIGVTWTDVTVNSNTWYRQG